MLAQVIYSDIFFASGVFAFLSLFASGWLHLDAWRIEIKNKTSLIKSLGFFALAVSFLMGAIQNEDQFLTYSSYVFKFYGLVMIIISLFSTPILKKPDSLKAIFIPVLPPIILSGIGKIIGFLLFLSSTIVFFVRTIKGLEKQTKLVAYSFLVFTISEFFKIFSVYSGSKNVFINNLLSEYGIVKLTIVALEIIASGILFAWVWNYLRFRPKVQIFIITSTSTLLIFLLTTFTYTFILFKNIEGNFLSFLKTNVKVALYSLERLEFEAMANSKAISQKPELVSALDELSKATLFDISNEFMLSQNLSFLQVTDKTGKVIVAAEDEDLKNISLSEDPVALSAIKGESLATISVKSLPLVPTVEIRSSSPVTNEGSVIGAVVGGFNVDNALLDGIKSVTDLEITVFANDTRSASTIFSEENTSRFIGTKETNANVLESVLKNGETYSGAEKIINQPYYLAFTPIRTYNNEVIGMISAGKPQLVIADTVKKAINATFGVSAILMCISILPSYLLAKYIEENVTA